MSSALRGQEEQQGQPVAYEWADDQPSLKVLWGRVLALLVLLVAVYLAGRTSGPLGNSNQVESLQTRLAASEERIATLEERLKAKAAADDLGAAALASETSVAPAESGEDEQTGAAAQAKPAANSDKGGAAKAEEAKGGDGSPSKSPAEPAAKVYTVRSGDTLNGLADRYYGSPSFVGLIKRANDIRNAAQIHAGQKLSLPPKP